MGDIPVFQASNMNIVRHARDTFGPPVATSTNALLITVFEPVANA